METQQLLEQLFQVFLTALLPIITLLGTYLSLKIKKYIDEKVENEKFNQYLTDVNDALRESVFITAQEYTSSLKKEQGCLTEEQQKIALEKAKKAFELKMGNDAKIILREMYDDYDKFVEDKVKSILGESKL